MFQIDLIANKLSQLEVRRRALFAAMTTERLASFFRHYASSNPDELQTFNAGLDYVWSRIEATSNLTDKDQDARQSSIIEKILPSEDDLTPYAAQANDAVAALLYSIQSLTEENSKVAAWAAQRAYDSVDAIVNQLPDSSGNIPTDFIDSHPLLDSELSQQKADLSAAKDAQLGDFPAVRAHAAKVGEALLEKILNYS